MGSTPCSHLLPRQSWLSPTQGWGRESPAAHCSEKPFLNSGLSHVPHKHLGIHPQVCDWRENGFLFELTDSFSQLGMLKAELKHGDVKLRKDCKGIVHFFEQYCCAENKTPVWDALPPWC